MCDMLWWTPPSDQHGNSNVWNDACIYVAWLMYTYVWHGTFICVTCLVHMCDMTRSYVWYDPSMCDMTHLYSYVHMCDMTRSYAWHNSFICVSWHVHVCDMTHPCATWLIYMRDMTHANVWLDTCVRESCLQWQAWLIHMCDIHMSDKTHAHLSRCVCVFFTEHSLFHRALLPKRPLFYLYVTHVN